VDVWGVAEDVDHLERGGLLPLEADPVDRVDQRHRIALGGREGERQAFVEAAVDLQDASPVGHRLAELADGDLALRNEDGAAQAGPHGVGRRAGAGVPG
jgi:hypothetical protein